jgi:hypothetical protein
MSDRSGARRANRLIHEKSPYLLQHAYNPVDWYPWSPEAFEKAQRENRPIFLSIGYSTCHWCHVMEHESFEDPDVAKLMNETFVCIKVDREERPDIDDIYMTVCQMMTGSGGWPLTIFLTADQKPFFAATYIPKESRFGRLGMLELIPQVKALWMSQGEDVKRSAEEVTQALKKISVVSPVEELNESVLQAAYEQLARSFDEGHGGFGRAPKFPIPHHLTFLLRYWRRSGQKKALVMVEKTLQAMRLGGIYDHLGFGFHRYSTDAHWLTPHFEKMLYDQALLAMAYTEAYQATGKGEYERTAREILTYVLRDMTAPEGGFYSAEDADSEGEEGKFYLWFEEELRETLSREEAELLIRLFNVEAEGNFHDEATQRKTGRNILHLKQPLHKLARELSIDENQLLHRLDVARAKLFALRERRVRPHKDDKILTDWNGLMIAAFAKAAQAFDELHYAESAKRAADFVLREMLDSDGRLLHRYREGDAAVPAFLDDYAFFIWGLLELYEATFEVCYLETALELNGVLLQHFWDEPQGGFFFTADDTAELLVRKKEGYDGAVPSGNSVAMLNLLRLARMTANSELEERAIHIARAFSSNLLRSPSSHTHMLCALDFALGPSQEVVIAGDLQARDTQQMLRALRRAFIPHKVVLFRPSEMTPKITNLAEHTKGMTSRKGKATAYVCQNYQCRLPTTDTRQMLELLDEASRSR